MPEITGLDKIGNQCKLFLRYGKCSEPPAGRGGLDIIRIDRDYAGLLDKDLDSLAVDAYHIYAGVGRECKLVGCHG